MSEESRLYRWSKLFVENWKAVTTILALLGTSTFTSCQWSDAEEKAYNEKQAAQYLADVINNVSRGTSVDIKPLPSGSKTYHTHEKTIITEKCNFKPILEKLDMCISDISKLKEHHE